MTIKKKVALIEDNKPFQKQLVGILNSTSDMECPVAVSSAEEALKILPRFNPDVILLDINLPGKSGIDCLPELRLKIPKAEVLILTAYEEDDNIFRALKAGASGYILKSSHKEELVDAIRQVHSGGSSFSSHIARKVVRYFQKEGAVESVKGKLSPREREVLDLFAAGYAYKEAAEQTGLTVGTLRTYVRRICVKLHVRNRVEAVFKYRL